MDMASEDLGDLLAGKSIEAVVRESAISPREAVLALGEAGLEGGGPGRPALVQQDPRNPRLRDALSERSLARLFPGVSQPKLLALSAGLLLIHDFWDASHEAAQRADDLGERATSPYWHGIAHRREPDPGNASYWFRRVGRHPIFPELAASARALIAEHPEAEAAGRRLSANPWDPYAMIDVCTGAKPGSPVEALAIAIQRVEMRLLLEATLASVSG